MGLGREVKLESMMVRRLVPMSGGGPEYFRCTLFLIPKPHSWWRSAFDDHVAGPYRTVAWLGSSRVRIECREREIGQVLAAIASANEDWKEDGARVAEWDAGFEAYQQGEHGAGVNGEMEYIELTIPDYDGSGEDSPRPGEPQEGAETTEKRSHRP